MPGYLRLVPTGQIQTRPVVEVREQLRGSRGRTAVTQCSTTPRCRIRARRRESLPDVASRSLNDGGEVGSTTGRVRLTEPLCIGQPQNQGN
jgi:hypothetical protein